jgi:SAM-dependent methyltransferase
MPQFNQEYYNDVFPDSGLHRHDYANDFAEFLIQKYGKVKFLDVGCGCGYLVKVLREKGCDAWGVELSSTALQNSCAPDYVVTGSLLSLPFTNSSFDVLFTNGVMGYFPKEKTKEVIDECKRVAPLQFHNIDYEVDYSYDFMESKEWWEVMING